MISTVRTEAIGSRGKNRSHRAQLLATRWPGWWDVTWINCFATNQPWTTWWTTRHVSIRFVPSTT